jgi:predicted site-specific integrase-resolvase
MSSASLLSVPNISKVIVYYHITTQRRKTDLSNTIETTNGVKKDVEDLGVWVSQLFSYTYGP